MLEYGVGGLVIFILILMTYLYSSIFIAEEKSEIALLKSLGFTDGSIKSAHIIRIILLALAAAILGELLLQTAGQAIVGMIMESLGITGFAFLSEWVFSVCVIPCILTRCCTDAVAESGTDKKDIYMEYQQRIYEQKGAFLS